LNIDNKIYPLPIWRYVTKTHKTPLCISLTLTRTSDFGKIVRQQWTIHCPYKCQISIKYANAKK